MKIFISYRRADSKYVVDRIRDRLIVAFGEQSIFRDIESIPLGKNFSTVLESETNGCDVMLVIIGPEWAGITDTEGNKRLFDPADFTRLEIEIGLNREGILVIPVMVMNAPMPTTKDLPESLSNLLYRNAISVRNDPDFDNDMRRLILGITQSNDDVIEINQNKESFEPETINIPEGSFLMGSPAGEGIPDYETPQYEIKLSRYHIGKFPLKNSEFEEFVRQTGKLVPRIMQWKGQLVPNDRDGHPALGVTWNEAIEYCKWLSQITGRKYFLPNEAQWEKACRGSYGCSELVGSILQWTCTLWGEKQAAPDPKYCYPWKDDGRNSLKETSLLRVVRGIVSADINALRRCTARRGRDPNDPGFPDARHGFRVAMID